MTYHVKITSQDGERGVQRELLARTITTIPDDEAARQYADALLRNFEGGKSHLPNVRCAILRQDEGGPWRAVWVRARDQPWAAVQKSTPLESGPVPS